MPSTANQEVILLHPNSSRFLGQKGVFILLAIMAFLLVSFVPLALAEEQTDTLEAGGAREDGGRGQAPRSRFRRLYGADP